MSKESKSKEAERAMMGRIFFEKKWDDLRKIYGRQGEVTSTGGSTENNAPGCSLRRETSPGGTVREFYADGSEKEPDVSTAEPVGLGRRIVLGYARRAPVESLVNMHQMYRAESARLNGAFEVNDSTPQAEFLNRAGLKALPEESELHGVLCAAADSKIQGFEDDCTVGQSNPNRSSGHQHKSPAAFRKFLQGIWNAQRRREVHAGRIWTSTISGGSLLV
jgi:hypothetical protein